MYKLYVYKHIHVHICICMAAYKIYLHINYTNK